MKKNVKLFFLFSFLLYAKPDIKFDYFVNLVCCCLPLSLPIIKLIVQKEILWYFYQKFNYTFFKEQRLSDPYPHLCTTLRYIFCRSKLTATNLKILKINEPFRLSLSFAIFSSISIFSPNFIVRFFTWLITSTSIVSVAHKKNLVDPKIRLYR